MWNNIETKKEFDKIKNLRAVKQAPYSIELEA
jgi:hypothetical protein